ncbi:hypothetical protein [Rhodococcus sp. SMB37]|uniref:hypothetical protein n=1 Tax=Rhodococcus sp. SMB37 TaxID=2512213 RepID=UPI00104A59A4|nr:hypothetical protein [Rhodococcus sp. SMB37]
MSPVSASQGEGSEFFEGGAGEQQSGQRGGMCGVGGVCPDRGDDSVGDRDGAQSRTDHVRQVRWQRQRQTMLLECGLGAAEPGEGVVAAGTVGDEVTEEPVEADGGVPAADSTEGDRAVERAQVGARCGQVGEHPLR